MKYLYPFISILAILIPSVVSSQCNNTPDLIIYNGNIITMDESMPAVSAMAIKDGLVMDIGDDSAITSLLVNGCATHILNVQGLTVMPGFNDAHSHWFSWREHICSREGHEFIEYPELEQIMDTLSYYGWTSISELNFGSPDYAPDHLNNALDLDQRGLLSVRLNGYWGTYDHESFIDMLENNGRYPDQEFSDRIRAPGVKIYVDDPFGTADILSQEDVLTLVRKAHNAGWAVAAHCVNESAMEKILTAYSDVLGSGDNSGARHRIEHVVKVNNAQLTLMADKGILACFQLIGSDEWPLQETFQTYLSNNNTQFLLRWKDMYSNGVPMVGSTDAPFNNTVCDYNPLRAVHQGITRKGYAERPLEGWELAQRLTIEESIRSLTVGAAYGTGEENVKGSLAPGMYADFIVLSEDPLAVDHPDELLKIKNLMTVVGGNVEYCGLDLENELCETGEGFVSDNMLVSASKYLHDQQPVAAFDDNESNNWGSGSEAPQWIQIDFLETKKIKRIELLTDQFPAGNTTHEIYAWAPGDAPGFTNVHTFKGFTASEQLLIHEFPDEGIEASVIKVLTTSSPSWVSWREIRFKNDVQTSSVDLEMDHDIDVFPVPWKNTLNLNITLDRQADLSMQLLNYGGKILKVWQRVKYASGKHTLPIDTGDLDLISGNYLLVIKMDNAQVVKKVLYLSN